MSSIMQPIEDVYVYNHKNLLHSASQLIFILNTLRDMHNRARNLVDMRGLPREIHAADIPALLEAARVINKYFEPKRLVDHLQLKASIFNNLSDDDKLALTGSTNMPDLTKSLLPSMSAITQWLHNTPAPSTVKPKLPDSARMRIEIKKAMCCLNPYALGQSAIFDPYATHNPYHANTKRSAVNQAKTRASQQFDTMHLCPVDGLTEKMIIHEGNGDGVGQSFRHQTTNVGAGQPVHPVTGELYLFTEECRRGGATLYGGGHEEHFRRPLNESPLYVFHARAWARRMYAETLHRFNLTIDPIYGQPITHYENQMFERSDVPLYMMELAKEISMRQAKNVNRQPTLSLYCWFYDNDQDPHPGPLPHLGGLHDRVSFPEIVRFYQVRDCPYFEGRYSPDIYERGGAPIKLNELKMLWMVEAMYWFPKLVPGQIHTNLSAWSDAYDAVIFKIIDEPMLSRYRAIQIPVLTQVPTHATVLPLNGQTITPSDNTMSETTAPRNGSTDEEYEALMGEKPPVINPKASPPPPRPPEPLSAVSNPRDSAPAATHMVAYLEAPDEDGRDYTAEQEAAQEFVEAFESMLQGTDQQKLDVARSLLRQWKQRFSLPSHPEYGPVHEGMHARTVHWHLNLLCLKLSKIPGVL